MGYWTSKWGGNGDSQCPSCRKLSKRADHFNRCKKEARTAVFINQITLIEEWMESTYTHPEFQTWLIVYLKKRNNKRFQDLEGLPRSMNTIVEEHATIGWANFVEGRMTKRI